MSADIVFLDFDNTITKGDVLDSVIERFASDDTWADLEREWLAGRISTRECLDGQIRSLRVTWPELRKHLRDVTFDPDFVPLLQFLREQNVEHMIVSDNFTVIINEILKQQGITGVPVFANQLTLRKGRAVPAFPHSNPEHPKCAHCKRLHLQARPHQRHFYVGDGKSDICPSLVADVVFAKDSLLRVLNEKGHPCREITGLGDVLEFFRTVWLAGELPGIAA